MRSGKGRTPKYRLHKTSGRAVVTLSGRDIYVGKYGSAASEEKYDRLIREWLENGRRLPGEEQRLACLTMSNLVLRYWEFAKTYYRKDGRPTGEQAALKAALRFVVRRYPDLPAIVFRPKALKACRQDMIDHGLVRTSINTHVGRIKRLIGWAVEEELRPASVHHGLMTVKGLERDRCDAPEGEGLRGAPGRGSSRSPSTPRSRKRRRHFPTVSRDTSRASATARFEPPFAQRRMIRARRASACAVLRRRVQPVSTSRCSSVRVSGSRTHPRPIETSLH